MDITIAINKAGEGRVAFFTTSGETVPNVGDTIRFTHSNGTPSAGRVESRVFDYSADNVGAFGKRLGLELFIQ